MKILIFRKDKIGDLILSLPLASIIKEQMPGAEVWFCVRNYERIVVEACDDVDGTINWDEMINQSETQAVLQLAQHQFDVFIDLFFVSNHVALRLAKLAGIKIRAGNIRRVFKSKKIFYVNRFINISRRKTYLHRSQINTRYLEPLGIYCYETVDQLAARVNFSVDPEPSSQEWLAAERFNLIMHMGSNGSAPEWPAERWIELSHALPERSFNILLTGNAKEAERFAAVIHAMPPSVNNTMGKLSLKQLMALINSADGLMGSSTGPTHISALLNKPTLGLYHCYHPIGSFRWRPIGKQAEYLVAEALGEGNDMMNIKVEDINKVILRWQSQKATRSHQISDDCRMTDEATT